MTTTEKRLLKELLWIRKALQVARPLLAERGHDVDAMLVKAATIQARLQGGRISLEAANEAIEQLLAPLAILGWEHEASDEPNVTPEEFWATVEAFAPKASSQQAAAG